jgi:spore germination protein YaaH
MVAFFFHSFFLPTLADKKTNQMHQVWFDDPSSIKIKTTWAKSAGLGGVGMWTADFVKYPISNPDAQAMWDAMSLFFS